MLLLQDHVRSLVNHDLDCSEPSIRLMAMRAEMVDLIRQRKALGGIEACHNIAERLARDRKPELRRRTMAGNEKPGRSRVLSV